MTKSIVNKVVKDKKVLFLFIVGIVLLLAGIITATYTETAFKFGSFSIEDKPYTSWTPPLIVAGVVVLALAIYLTLGKK